MLHQIPLASVLYFITTLNMKNTPLWYPWPIHHLSEERFPETYKDKPDIICLAGIPGINSTRDLGTSLCMRLSLHTKMFPELLKLSLAATMKLYHSHLILESITVSVIHQCGSLETALCAWIVQPLHVFSCPH